MIRLSLCMIVRDEDRVPRRFLTIRQEPRLCLIDTELSEGLLDAPSNAEVSRDAALILRAPGMLLLPHCSHLATCGCCISVKRVVLPLQATPASARCDPFLVYYQVWRMR